MLHHNPTIPDSSEPVAVAPTVDESSIDETLELVVDSLVDSLTDEELEAESGLNREVSDLELRPLTKLAPLTQTAYDHCADLIVGDAVQMMRDAGATGPEITYPVGSFYTIVIPFILSELKIAFSLPQHALVGPIWNYIDSLFAFMLTTAMFAQASENARPNAEIMKGILNLLGGIQLTTLTTLGFFIGGAAAMSGLGFAAAGAAGFIISMDETVRSYRRMTDMAYWMKDSKAQLLKWEEQVTQLEKDLEQLKALHKTISLSDAKKLEWSTWVINRKKERLDTLVEDIKELKLDIRVREKVIVLSLNQETGVESRVTQDQLLTDEEQIRENRIQKDCKVQFELNRKESTVLFLAFAGMLLMCFPPTEIVGIACVAIASAYFLKKNAPKIAAGVKSIVKSIFRFFCCPSEKEEKPSAVEKDLVVLRSPSMSMA